MSSLRRCLPLLLVCTLAEAAPPRRAPAPAEAWAILLASAAQRPEVEAKLKAMQQAHAFAFLKPSEGHPRIAESTSLPGLEPGLHVVVLGVCGSRREALAAQARVRPEVGDAYVKRLASPVTLACPEPVNLKSKLPKDAQRIASFPFGQGQGLTLEVHEGHTRSQMECSTSDLILRLVHDGRVLAEDSIQGSCQGACTEKDQREGREEVERLQQAVERGEESNSALDYNFTRCQTLAPGFERVLDGLGNPLLLVTDPTSAPHDGIQYPLRLVGVGCGRLVVSADFMGADASAYGLMSPNVALEALQVRPSGSTPATWKRFALFAPDTEQDAGTPAEKWFAGFEWKDERCTWNITEWKD